MRKTIPPVRALREKDCHYWLGSHCIKTGKNLQKGDIKFTNEKYLAFKANCDGHARRRNVQNTRYTCCNLPQNRF